MVSSVLNSIYKAFSYLPIDDSKQEEHYNTVQEGDYHEKKHDPSFVHELIAGAASFEAAKAYENHVAENGKDISPNPNANSLTLCS